MFQFLFLLPFYNTAVTLAAADHGGRALDPASSVLRKPGRRLFDSEPECRASRSPLDASRAGSTRPWRRRRRPRCPSRGRSPRATTSRLRGSRSVAAASPFLIPALDLGMARAHEISTGVIAGSVNLTLALLHSLSCRTRR
jgi:hypothetical protein